MNPTIPSSAVGQEKTPSVQHKPYFNYTKAFVIAVIVSAIAGGIIAGLYFGTKIPPAIVFSAPSGAALLISTGSLITAVVFHLTNKKTVKEDDSNSVDSTVVIVDDDAIGSHGSADDVSETSEPPQGNTDGLPVHTDDADQPSSSSSDGADDGDAIPLPLLADVPQPQPADTGGPIMGIPPHLHSVLGKPSASVTAEQIITALGQGGAFVTEGGIVHPRTDGAYTTEEIGRWMFEERAPLRDGDQASISGIVFKGITKESIRAQSKPIITAGKLFADPSQGKVAIYGGSLTDIRIEDGKVGSVIVSNNGDLKGCCGYAVATSVHCNVGPAAQTAAYNCFGVPGVMHQPQHGQTHYSATEGRGYSITLPSGDMLTSHGMIAVEMVTVPYNYPAGDETRLQTLFGGVENMYFEALEHAHLIGSDYIVVPGLLGTSHPLLSKGAGDPYYADREKCAELVMSALHNFYRLHPDSKLKVIFSIFGDPTAEEAYKQAFVAEASKP